MNPGTYIVGTVKGYSEQPWENKQSGKSGMNRRLGIATNTYEDEWGEKHQDIQNIDVQQDSVAHIAAQAEKLKGKKVMIAVVWRAKTGGRNGAWLSCFLPKDADLIALKQD